MASRNEEPLKSVLSDLEKQMSRKQTFEQAMMSLTSIVRDKYASAAASEQIRIYCAVCRAATLLQTRYTARGLWSLGLKLFEEVLRVVVQPEEKKQVNSFISRACTFLGEDEARVEVPAHMQAGTSAGYLFDGQLTVGQEPPPPSWLVVQNALTALLVNQETAAGAQEGNEGALGEPQLHELMQRMRENMGTEQYMGLEEAIQATLQETRSRGPPAASKAEVAKLPIVAVSEDVLEKLGQDTECAVCREVLVSGDTMQEMPCKHSFHPPCLKPWLDEHNSCPICRAEMKTDDEEYERKKEREKEEEKERKGAANALRGGEFMYT